MIPIAAITRLCSLDMQCDVYVGESMSGEGLLPYIDED